MTDTAGNPSTGQLLIEGGLNYVLRGDANRDRRVDVSDLGILSTNFNRGGNDVDLFTADFNYDGRVNVTDLGILSTNYNRAVSGPAPTAVEATAPPRGLWARRHTASLRRLIDGG